MKLFRRSHDGGKKSGVTGFWLVEIKGLFSIVFLRFGKGSRENYHSHAFDAITFWLKGRVIEDRLDTGTKTEFRGPSLRPKFTPRRNIHRVLAQETTYALCFRGPWRKTWFEYDPVADEYIELTNGRNVVRRFPNPTPPARNLAAPARTS